MPLSPHPTNHPNWRSAVCWFYQISLALYPQNFRDQFSLEMKLVFEEALDDAAQAGWVSSLLFLGREVIETPLSALNQQLVIMAAWTRNYLYILCAYTLGFLLLGLIDLLLTTRIPSETQGDLITLLMILLIGGLGGLAVGIILSPRRKSLFTLAGAVCLLASILFPSLVGWIFLILLSLVIHNWRGLLRLAGYGTLALLVGFFVNRLAAALVESYLYHSPTQELSQTGAGMILIPLLITGLSLGIYLGGIASKSAVVKA